MTSVGVREKILQDMDDLHKFIILLAAANAEPIRGRLKLQKLMYLVADRTEKIKEQCSYDADNYGPYSEVVDEEARYLEQMGILTSGPGEIALTKMGKEIARELNQHENKETLTVLDRYKEFLNDMTSKELLTYIYLAYPDMTGESLEYERLKPDMERHIMSLIKKEKITAQLAAELLGQTLNYIIERMYERGMPFVLR